MLINNITTAISGFSDFEKISRNLSKAILAVGVAVSSVKILQFITGEIKASVNAFQEAEDATNRFGIALASLGKFSATAVSDFREFAREIQRTTRFTDEAVTAAGALIAQIGRLSGQELREAT